MTTAYLHSAPTSVQFTTAGSAIDLVSSRPGFGSNPNTQNPVDKPCYGLWITSGSGNLILVDKMGNTDTFEVVVGTTPYLIPRQAYSIDASSTSGIKGNILYAQ
jgi:hypothetical protein